jgi:GT2 family glycosyltransferase
MKLSICIVNYNSRSLLESCLDSINKFSPSYPYEIIIVDNYSTDGSLSPANKRKGIRVVQNTENVGFAAANNQAFICSKGEYLLMLNADTEVKQNSLDELIICADQHPEAGLVSAKLVNPDGSPQVCFNVRRFPGYGSEFAQLLLFDELWPKNPLTSHYLWRDLDYERLQYVEQPAASALLYRRSAWEEVGGFDERFSNWYNDVDLCKRVEQAGLKILFCPTSEILHHGGMGVASRSTDSVMIEMYRSKRMYFYKYFGYGGYLWISSLTIIGMTLRVAALFLRTDLQLRVNTRARNARSDNAIPNAFQAVFVDTITTLKVLPSLWRSA